MSDITTFAKSELDHKAWGLQSYDEYYQLMHTLITTIESQKEELEALNKAHHVWLKRHVDYKEQIESQKEEIERLQIDRSDWEEEYMSLKRRFEDLDKSALETLELLNGPNEQVESLKAITELALKGLKQIKYSQTGMICFKVATNTLEEIERLSNGTT